MTSKPRKAAIKIFVGAAAGAMLLVPAPAGSMVISSGEASTSNTILSVSVGSTNVNLGLDLAESRRGSATSALARFTTVKTPDITFKVAERSAERASDSGTDDAGGAEDFDLGVLSGSLVGVSATAEIGPARVAASTTGELVDLDVLNGLISFDGLETVSQTEATEVDASANRTISLDGLDLLHIGDLLDHLGIDPFALACDAIEAAGSTLAADTSEACEHLADAEAAITETGAVLDSERSELDGLTDGYDEDDVGADRDEAADAGTACDPSDLLGYPACVAAALTDLATLATEYDVDPSDPTDLEQTRNEVVAALDEILDAFDDLGVVSSADLGDTCASVADAVDDVIAGLSEDDPAGVAEAIADSGVQAELDQACGGLEGTLDALLATPLLRIDDVSIVLDAVARAGNPAAAVTASIGSIAIGLDDPVEIDVLDAVETAEAVGAEVEAVLDDLLGDFGVDVDAPDIELLVVETGTGQDADGDWFADASLTTLRLTIPGAVFDVDEGSDRALAILDGSGGSVGGMAAPMMGALGVPVRALLGATVTAPDVVVDAAVFDAGAQYRPTGDIDDPDPDDPDPDDPGPDERDGDLGKALPKTGVGGDKMMVGLTFGLAALLIRRFALQRP